MRNRILWTPLITMALLIPITSQAQLISVQGTGTVEIEAEFATLGHLSLSMRRRRHWHKPLRTRRWRRC